MTSDDLLHLPAPGEPLQPSVHPDNQKLLDQARLERLELVRAKLTRRQLWLLNRRYKKLHAKLNRAKYNALVKRRQALAEEYAMLCASYRQKPSDKLKRQALKVAEQGKALNAKLASLTPLAQEFEQVAQRLANHRRAVQIELEEIENQKAFFAEADRWEQQIYAVFRQSPRLHHVQENGKKQPKVIIPKIKQVLIKPDRVYFEIRTTYQSWFDKWLGVWKSALPYGVDVKSLTSDETLTNLSASCGRLVTVERSFVSQNLFYVINRPDSADGIPNRIRHEQVIEHYPMERHAKTPWACGVGRDRKIEWTDFEKFPHVLVAGANGGGKSNLINQMLATIITLNTPDEVRLVLVDNKGGIELSHFNGIPHSLFPLVEQIDEVLPTLKRVRSIMEQRLATFRDASARSLASYNENSKTPVPRLIVVIDEMATLVGLGELTDEIHRELRVLSSQGRAVGVHLVISTQHPSRDVLPGWVKTNLNLRIAGKMPHHTASQIVVDSISAAALPDVPGRMVFRQGGYELILQTPLIEDAGIAKAVSIAKEFTTPQNTPNTPEPPHVPKFGRDDYLKVVIDQLGGRLSPARVHEIVGNAVMPLAELRKLGQQVREEIQSTQSRLTFEGTTYHMQKERNTFVLLKIEPTETPTEQESGSSLHAEKLFSYSVHSVEEIEDENAILESA